MADDDKDGTEPRGWRKQRAAMEAKRDLKGEKDDEERKGVDAAIRRGESAAAEADTKASPLYDNPGRKK